MRVSRYVRFIPLADGSGIAYSPVTGWSCQLTDPVLKSLFHQRDSSLIALIPQQLVSELADACMIVDDDFDEVSFAQYRMLQEAFDPSVLAFTILPTTRCNFACVYCYQETHGGKTMDLQTAHRLTEWITDHIGPGTREVKVTWFGGEPLLALDIIEKISVGIIDVCESCGVDYEAHIVTNGYGLNRHVAARLKVLKVVSCQVTLDGPPDVHDKRRLLKNGRPTFNTILDNLSNAIDMFAVTVRVNVDQENLTTFSDLVALLDKKGLLEKLRCVSPGLVVCEGRLRQATQTRVCPAEPDSLRMVVREYLGSASVKAGRPDQFYPIPFGTCGARRQYSWLIEPDGTLQKCWLAVGRPEYSVGSLFDPPGLTAGALRWFRLLLFDAECHSCDRLPVCGGGCAWHAYHGRRACTTWAALDERIVLDLHISGLIDHYQAAEFLHKG